MTEGPTDGLRDPLVPGDRAPASSPITDPVEFTCGCGQRIVASFSRLDRDPHIVCSRCDSSYIPVEDYTAVMLSRRRWIYA